VTAYVRVSLGGERYAVDVAHVREVTQMGAVVTVPGAGPHVVGVSDVHGELVTVIRISELLSAPRGSPRRLVVVEDHGRLAGLCVDGANEVEQLPEPVAAAAPLTNGAVLHDGCTIGILDVPAVLDAVGESVRR
jgi:purine-binding chemotaxis protein CheW